ncbi:hypothetical protein ACFO5X_10690 [Seohaeicola nanhaiensis]|uniref:DUF4352 domain-containing protein n=1 Tax=Seohaeicola nanhaiensis TaxID=1387282 RepID=A0ABV9KG09_9RHOB
MSNVDGRNDTPIIAFALIIITLVVGMIGYSQGLESNLELEHDDRAELHKYEAAQSIERECIRASGVLVPDCIAKKLESYSDDYGRSEDLAAQKGMALWAKSLLILTVVTTGTAVLALIYVRLTLIETQKMAKDTREIGEAQVRAYVSIDEATVDISEKDGVFIGVFSLTVRNSGQSPARGVNVQFAWEKDASQSSGPVMGDLASGMTYNVIDYSTQLPGKNVMFFENPDLKTVVRLFIWIQYADVFARQGQKILEGGEFVGSLEKKSDDVFKLTQITTETKHRN